MDFNTRMLIGDFIFSSIFILCLTASLVLIIFCASEERKSLSAIIIRLLITTSILMALGFLDFIVSGGNWLVEIVIYAEIAAITFSLGYLVSISYIQGAKYHESHLTALLIYILGSLYVAFHFMTVFHLHIQTV